MKKHAKFIRWYLVDMLRSYIPPRGKWTEKLDCLLHDFGHKNISLREVDLLLDTLSDYDWDNEEKQWIER